jgi:methyl-accepting chemotaxis protein
MTSGSSLSRLRLLALTAVALAVVELVIEGVGGQLGLINGVLCAGVVATGAYGLVLIRKLEAAVRRASMVCQAVAAGDLEVRISGIDEGGDLGEMLWSVNELADRTDAFLREAAAAMGVVAQGRYFRRILVSGFQGSFITSSEAINAAVAAMGAQAAEQRRIEGEVSSLVDSAVVGDFSHRLSTDDKAGFMMRLSQGINQVVGTVQTGLDEVVGVVGAMAEGNLSRRMTKDYQGAFARLKTDLNQTAEQLDQIVGGIVRAAHAVGLGVGEIAAGNGDLANRTEEQASKLEAMAAAVEQLTATVRKNAENTKEADGLAASARAQADDGGRVVHDVIDAMGRIEVSSSRIADIVGMIDEIAFQTNLLALNAAVEAARAGDAGKGFAVVANEVRSLAQRSAESSKEIRRLIGASQSEVGRGVKLINEADDTLKAIIGSVQKLADIVSEIATATREQSLALEDVSRSVNVIEDMTQKNAALAEETASTSINVHHKAGELKDTVAFFAAQEEEAPPPVRAPEKKRRSLVRA